MNPEGNENPIDPQVDRAKFPSSVPKTWKVPTLLSKAQELAQRNLSLPDRKLTRKDAVAIYDQARSMAIEKIAARKKCTLPMMTKTKPNVPRPSGETPVSRKKTKTKIAAPVAAANGIASVPPSQAAKSTNVHSAQSAGNSPPGNERGLFDTNRNQLTVAPAKTEEVQAVAATLNHLTVNDPQGPFVTVPPHPLEAPSHSLDGPFAVPASGPSNVLPAAGILSDPGVAVVPAVSNDDAAPYQAKVQVVVPMYLRVPTFSGGKVDWVYCSQHLYAIADLDERHLCVALSKRSSMISWANNVKTAAVMSLIFRDVWGVLLAKNTVPMVLHNTQSYRPLADRFTLALDYIYREDQVLKTVMSDRCAIGMVLAQPWWSTIGHLGRLDNNIPVGSPVVPLLEAIGLSVNIKKSAAWLGKYQI